MKRSLTNQSLHGVCAGIAHHFGLFPMAVRLLFVLTFPVSLFLYIFLANTLPSDHPSL